MKTLLLGDLSPTNVTNPLFKSKDVDALFNNTVSLFEGNDINLVNLECAITESQNDIKKFGPALKACRETLEVLSGLGVNVCNISNNHFFDFGIKGAEDTLKYLNELGLMYTGFGYNYTDSRNNLVIKSENEKVCIIAVCEHEYSYALEDRMGCRPYDEYDTMEDIRSAKKENDRVIVLYHGGKEFCQYPSPRLVKLCRAMAKNGADAILCQHSHCIGCYEHYNDCHILYGQGNFHFVKECIPDIETWHNSLAVKYDTQTNVMEFIPLVTTQCGIKLAEGSEKESIMSAFEKRNQSLKDGSWMKGWHEFCTQNADVYIAAAQSAAGLSGEEIGDSIFAHYLDCEAHTDVWRELFKTANHRNER